VGKSTQRDIYYEKMKNRAEVTGQALSVLLMTSKFSKHRKAAVQALENVNKAVAQVEEEYVHTRTC